MARAAKRAPAAKSARNTTKATARSTSKAPKAKGKAKTMKATSRPKSKAKTPASRKPAAKSAKPAAKSAKASKPAAKQRTTAKVKPATKRPAPRKAKAAAKPAPRAVKPKAQPAKAAKPAPEKTPVAVKEAPAPKPAAAKPVKEAPPEPPRKPRKPQLTPREIAAIKEELEVQRENFTRELAEMDEGPMAISQSEMSGEVSYDEEFADAGSFTFEREKELSIGNNIRDLLDKVRRALIAIEHNQYGICENCGDPIDKNRLKALPYSTLCIRCKTQEERMR